MSPHAAPGFTQPIFIVGAPRSGTSLLQKIIRSHPAVWSLPSESNEIWDVHCHPALRRWESEYLSARDVTPKAAAEIRRMFHAYLAPARTWDALERRGLIWGFERQRRLRQWLKPLYTHAFPVFRALFLSRPKHVRMLDKTASNCFRMGFVNTVFPDAKIIYTVRDGRNNINSLINSWMHPTRFFTYSVPAPLQIGGYPYAGWKFVLPPGWRGYVDQPLAEVCAFQWRACHEHLIAETGKPEYQGRVLRLRLEDLTADPEAWLRRIADFVELPFDVAWRTLAAELPVINSPDKDTAPDKWKRQHLKEIESILPGIAPLMSTLGYD